MPQCWRIKSQWVLFIFSARQLWCWCRTVSKQQVTDYITLKCDKVLAASLVLLEYKKGIQEADLQEMHHDLFIPLSGFSGGIIRLEHLISSVYTPHLRIVGNNAAGFRDSDPLFLSLAAWLQCAWWKAYTPPCCFAIWQRGEGQNAELSLALAGWPLAVGLPLEPDSPSLCHSTVFLCIMYRYSLEPVYQLSINNWYP